ncbi:hypothetical protein [uncultured Shewanella sp.]|nr:hypothetical protein [uncultured Shewanella sp.]
MKYSDVSPPRPIKAEHYPDTEKIYVVMANYGTHFHFALSYHKVI